MSLWLGDFPEDFTTVPVPFTTSDAAGAPIAPLSAFEAADVKIFKNGSDVEKTTTNGLTMSSPFNASVGVHLLLIDTSNNTGDTGFWTAGAIYSVLLEPDETVDGETVRRWIGQFSLGMERLANITKVNNVTVVGDGSVGNPWNPA